MADKMNIQQKIDEMIAFSEMQVLRFPEPYRYTFGEILLLTLYGLAELAESANRSEVKAPILQELDVKNATLKRILHHGHLAKNQDGFEAAHPLIDDEAYAVWLEKTNEIGRMIGGWIRSQNNAQKRSETDHRARESKV